MDSKSKNCFKSAITLTYILVPATLAMIFITMFWFFATAHEKLNAAARSIPERVFFKQNESNNTMLELTDLYRNPSQCNNANATKVSYEELMADEIPTHNDILNYNTMMKSKRNYNRIYSSRI